MNNEELMYNALLTSGYKVFPVIAPQNEKLPFITYKVTTKIQPYGLTCRSALTQTRFNVSIYTNTYKELKDIEEAVNTAIELETMVVYTTTETYEDSAFRLRVDCSLYK